MSPGSTKYLPPSAILLEDDRLNAAYSGMSEIAPFRYERYQAEYFLRHLRSYLAATENGDYRTALVDLHSPDITYFTSMDAEERNQYITDINELTADAELVELANSVKLASLEMNGGLGSSMGIDPALNQSKANGIRFAAQSDGKTFELSVMGAKMMHATHLAKRLGTIHFIPANSTITELGWQAFLEEKDLAKLPGEEVPSMINRDLLDKRNVQIHPSVIQQAFPRLDPKTGEIVHSNDPVSALAPGGHGQFLYHLYFSGKLHELAKEETQILVLANSDNINATPNPVIAAKMVRDNIMGSLVSTDRTPLDAKGGIFVIRDGKLDIIEMSSVLDNQKELFTQIGLRKDDGTQPFNTNTIYINIPSLLQHLEALGNSEGQEAVHSLLMPKTIPNKKPRGIQLEGAISSTILKFKDVRLFNASEESRSDEFTPLKAPIDASYYLDSDAFDYDANEHQLIKVRKGRETKFELNNWDGWGNVIATREVFGAPSFKDLDSLTISGAIRGPNAIWRGTVEIINDAEDVLDLTQIKLTLDNVRITKDAGGLLHSHSIVAGGFDEMS